jgi:hypothetical protein
MNDLKFRIAHNLFEAHMLTNSATGEPFTSFTHDFLRLDETLYKEKAFINGNDCLQLDKWEEWIQQTGQILRATKEACKPSVSQNLLEHRYEGSAKALSRVKSQSQVASLENALFDFFRGGSATEREFGKRLDTFASYLRKNQLGSNWAFVAYLAFLLDKDRYFPIRPTKFDRLLEYYEIPGRLAGYVSWDRYEILLNLVDELKERLLIFGPAKTIDIQSYMWVVSYLIEGGLELDIDVATELDFEEELRKRYSSQVENDRIGLLGEKYVYESERARLSTEGRPDLANRVYLVSTTDIGAGYDVSSFLINETELHIEVKTTTRRKSNDIGFFLTENERVRATTDQYWVIYRVWNVDDGPVYENLGNIVTSSSSEWEITSASWRVKLRQ